MLPVEPARLHQRHNALIDRHLADAKLLREIALAGQARPRPIGARANALLQELLYLQIARDGVLLVDLVYHDIEEALTYCYRTL